MGEFEQVLASMLFIGWVVLMMVVVVLVIRPRIRQQNREAVAEPIGQRIDLLEARLDRIESLLVELNRARDWERRLQEPGRAMRDA
jgi:hypothetical protein